MELSHTVKLILLAQKVFVCDATGPHSEVDLTGPKGVLECDGIVPHSCAGKTLQSYCLKLNFVMEDFVF